MEIDDSWKIHSFLFLLRECFFKILRIPTPFLEKHMSVFCTFRQFPLPLPKNPGVALTKTSLFHSRQPKSGEWISPKQASSTLRVECWPSVIVDAGMVGPAMPLRRTPRSVNSRCRRKATPSEGSTYRSEPVERSRMCPREGERSPRAYQEAQGQR